MVNVKTDIGMDKKYMQELFLFFITLPCQKQNPQDRKWAFSTSER